jgi:transcriptional regulator NrdR family protein
LQGEIEVKCGSCGSETRVLETRSSVSGLTVARRRECEGCSLRFTTYEVARGEVAVMSRRVRPSQNNAEGLKTRAEARRRVEELRDLQSMGVEELTMDELRKELGW